MAVELHQCPICHRDFEAREMELHHIRARSDGGPDCDANLLSICKTCHILTRLGTQKDVHEINMACSLVALSGHGLEFLKMLGVDTTELLGVFPEEVADSMIQEFSEKLCEVFLPVNIWSAD